MRANLTAAQCYSKALYYQTLSNEYMDRYLEKWEEETRARQQLEKVAVEAAGLGGTATPGSASEPEGHQLAEVRVLS